MTALNLLQDDFSGRSLIEASAGTGKTWTLTTLYARLLLERKLSVAQILVVTYTTAATAELRERIRDRLAALLEVYQQGPGEDELLNQLQARYPDADSQRRVLLAVHGFDEAAIFTIHGFCQRVLQDAAFEVAGDFDSELIQDERELLDALLADLWRQQLASAEPLWAAFLAQQRITPRSLRQQLQRHLGKPYLRIEPQTDQWPGFADLHQRWQQAAQCWWQHSADWLKCLKAFDGLNQRSYDRAKLDAWQSELDGYFRDPAAIFGNPEGLRRLSRERLLSGTKKGFETPLSPLADALQDLQNALESALAAAGQRLIALKVRLIEQLDRQLPERKAEQRLLAFDDLLNRLHQALDSEPGAHLARTLRSRYPLALIDEFQDTDPVQYAIFRRIYDAPERADLCFVGDPKQAIYAFRGADLNTYLQARADVTRRYSLATNHRSTPTLITALNRLFQRPMPFAEASLDYPPVAASPRARPTLQLPEELAPAALNLLWLSDEPLSKGSAGQLAASDCACRVAALLEASRAGQACFIEGDTRTPLRGSDIAILVANHRQAAEVAAQLARHAVPCVRRSKDSVWHSEEARELAAVLAAYAEPGREGLLRHALASRLLGRDSLALAAAQENIRNWDEERESAERYHQLWRQQGFIRAFQLWLDEQQVAERLLALADGERRLTNLLHLAELLQAESLSRPGLERLLDWLHEQIGSDHHGDDALLRLESDAERVQIVTIHTAKGLEYPLVFCPYLWDGSLLQRNESISCHADDGTPLLDLGSEQLELHRQRARQERFAERLRLVYVALTRARDRLWVHWGPVDSAVRKDGTLGAEGLHTSAMAWLLHGRQQPGQDALAELAEHLQQATPEQLLAELRELATTDAHIALCPLLDSAPQGQDGQRAPQPRHLARCNRELRPAWRIGSFSGLTAGRHSEQPDRDLPASASYGEPGEGFYAFPRGARAGTCLHAILEDWGRGKAALDQLIEPALSAHGIDAALWSDIARRQLQQVIHSELNEQGLTLAGLHPQRRLPELSFTFPVRQLDMHRLRDLLSDPQNGLEEPFRHAAAHLHFDALDGFLKGFIDLTFEHEGRWYIVDYKSNWLGPDASHYQGERLLQTLAGEHYYLQYLIYLVALRRFLRSRLGDGQDRLGGAYYLFLRAMPDSGLYFDRPTDVLLDQLDRLFQEGNA